MELINPYRKIAFISQPEYFRSFYENDLDEFGEVREFTLHYSMKPEDFSDLVAYDADVNVFFRGEFVPNEVLEKLRGVKINLSSEPFPREIDGHIEYTADSLARYRSFQMIRGKAFDHVFHYDASSLNFMRDDGLMLSGEFAFPIATGLYRPMDVPKTWDVFFIGRSSEHRERHFGALKHHYGFLHIAHGVWGPELIKYLSASRVCLNVHAENEISWEPRMQMYLACGAFVVSEPITPNRYLRPGVDYVVASGPSEMFDVVTHYLKHADERDAIARSGYERVQELLCSKKVFPRLFREIANNQHPRFAVGPRMKNLRAHLAIQKCTHNLRQLWSRAAG
jgi:hypothetical protein